MPPAAPAGSCRPPSGTAIAGLGGACTPQSGGRPARRFARQMKKVQSALGDHQDTVVGRQEARQLGIAAHLAGESAFTYGLFYERDACLAASLQTRAQKAWQRASRGKYRAWLA